MNGVINTVSNTSSADNNVNATVSRDATTPTDAAIDAETSDKQVIDLARGQGPGANTSDLAAEGGGSPR